MFFCNGISCIQGYKSFFDVFENLEGRDLEIKMKLKNSDKFEWNKVYLKQKN